MLTNNTIIDKVYNCEYNKGHPEINNCIIDEILHIPCSQVSYSLLSQQEYCDINGNISADPLFINPTPDSNTIDDLIETGDYDGAMQYLKSCYSLQPDSNCIDTGNPSYLLDPDGTRADMGAVYFDQDRNMFIRGDANRDEKVDALDAIPIIYHLFENKKLECKDSADVDDNGNIDVNDVIYLIDYLYRDGNQPPEPFPTAGYDLTHDALACYVPVNYGNANINNDCKVDFKDFAIFADSWLEKGLWLKGDIDGDKTVDFRDLRNIADNWLWYDYLRCVYPYPLSRQKTGVFKVDSSPCVKAVGTKGARRATGVPTATPYTSAGVR